jgi:tetratricopeptide (TPR) repeat protein
MGPIKPATPTENGAPTLEPASAEFLPDEDVIDDVPESSGRGSNVVFAGPSDAPPGGMGSREVAALGDAEAELRISQSERRDSIRYFVVLVAVLAATVASVFARPRDPGHDSVDVSTAQTSRPLSASSGDLTGAPSSAGAENHGDFSAPAPSATAIAEALAAKRASQAALEEGRANEAIEAGERAVALDPTDAEAWLILGAGYDQRGTRGDARRCFTSCVRLATHGPRGECAALLR